MGKLVAAIMLVAGMIAATPVRADGDTQVVGAEEFRLHCAACHGLSGLGDGPVGPLLKTPAPNLALISERNGGKFPFQRVYEIIDGRSMVAAHGSRDMPVWGDRYRKDPKPMTPDQEALAGDQAQQRILSLVYYIGTLQ
jgi:mono/diheme cytochrome c family protein